MAYNNTGEKRVREVIRTRPGDCADYSPILGAYLSWKPSNGLNKQLSGFLKEGLRKDAEMRLEMDFKDSGVF